MRRKYLIDVLLSLGYKFTEQEIESMDIWEDAQGLIYFTADEDPDYGYDVCVNPEAQLSCTKGHGKGCIWSDWE